jgi:hypothetical protein
MVDHLLSIPHATWHEQQQSIEVVSMIAHMKFCVETKCQVASGIVWKRMTFTNTFATQCNEENNPMYAQTQHAPIIGVSINNFRSTYIKGPVTVLRKDYANRRIALALVTPKSARAMMPEVLAVATVNVPAYNPVGTYDVLIKNWSENEGIADELVKHGIIKPAHKTFRTGSFDAKVTVHELLQLR